MTTTIDAPQQLEARVSQDALRRVLTDVHHLAGPSVWPGTELIRLTSSRGWLTASATNLAVAGWSRDPHDGPGFDISIAPYDVRLWLTTLADTIFGDDVTLSIDTDRADVTLKAPLRTITVPLHYAPTSPLPGHMRDLLARVLTATPDPRPDTSIAPAQLALFDHVGTALEPAALTRDDDAPACTRDDRPPLVLTQILLDRRAGDEGKRKPVPMVRVTSGTDFVGAIAAKKIQDTTPRFDPATWLA